MVVVDRVVGRRQRWAGARALGIGVADHPVADPARRDIEADGIKVVGRRDPVDPVRRRTHIGARQIDGGDAVVGDVLHVVGRHGPQAQIASRAWNEGVERGPVRRLDVQTLGAQTVQVLVVQIDEGQLPVLVAEIVAVALDVVEQTEVGRLLGVDEVDHPLNLDLIIVNGGGEARQEAGLEDDAEAQAIGHLRLDIGIALQVLDEGGGHAVDGDRVAAGGAGVEQLAHVRRPDVPGGRGAQGDVRDRRVGQARLPGGDAARRAVARVSGRAVEIEAIEDRHQGFDIALDHVVLTGGDLVVPVLPAGLVLRLDLPIHGLIAPFPTEGDVDRAGPSGEVGGEVHRHHVLDELLVAQRLAQHVVDGLLAGDADAEAVQRHAAVGRTGQG